MRIKGERFRSLKSRIMASVLAMGVACIAVLAVGGDRLLRSEVAALLGSQQEATVSLVADEVNANVRERFAALALIAESFEPELMDHPDQLQKRLDQRPLLRVLFNAGVMVTKVDGTAIAEVPPMGRVGLNYMDRDHIASALQQGLSSVGKPMVEKGAQAPSLAMTVPIWDARGQLIGAMAGAIDLSRPNFLDSINNSRYGDSGGYLIVDPVNRLFVTATANNRALVMKPLTEVGVNPVLDRRLQGFDGSAINVNSMGDEVMTTSARVPAAGWFVISTLPTREAFAPVRTLERRIFIAALVLVTVVFGLLWWLLRNLLSPMEAAAHSVMELARSGSTDARVAVARDDEIGNLVEGFNQVLAVSSLREKALLQSEMRFRHFFEKNALTQLLVNPLSGVIEDANQAAAAFYGYPRELLIGMLISQINTLSPVRIAEERMLALREARNYFQFQHRLASGEVRDVEVNSTPIEVNDRSLLLSLVHDVTDRKLAQEQLHLSLVEQQAILNSNIAGIVKLQDRRFVWMNHSFAALFGYSVEALVGQPTRLVYPSDDAYEQFAVEAYPRMLRGEIFHKEMQYLRKDGSLGWFDVCGEQIALDGSASIWCFLDITDKKNANLRMERLVAEQRALLNNDLVGIVTTRERLIVWANAAFEKMLGYAPGELAGTPTRQHYVNAADYEALGAEAYPVLAAGRVFRTQLRHHRKDGVLIWLEASGEMLDLERSEALWGFVDVTQRKLAEDRVHQLAFHDALTNLPNRRLLLDRLAQVMVANKRSGRFAALMFLDLDNFKPLNDQYGHEVGDMLLVEVALRLTGAVRAMDTVARFGGDEFVVMLNDLNADREASVGLALGVAEKVRFGLAQAFEFHVNHAGSPAKQMAHQCTASIGVTLFCNHHGTVDGILNQADRAMYQAKQRGRNQVHFHED